ncbi:hypothetical protein TNCT_377991, partial [Trichonephila clavata]
NETRIQSVTPSEQQLHHFGGVVDYRQMKEILLIELKWLILCCMKLKLLQRCNCESQYCKIPAEQSYSCMHLKMPGNHCNKTQQSVAGEQIFTFEIFVNKS